MLPSHLHVADFGIFAVVALFALVIALLCLFDFRKSSNGPSIPGPESKDPINGNLPDMKKTGSLHQYLVHLHKTYGPVVSFMWGTISVVSVSDPELWKSLKGLFDRPVELFKLFEPLIGKKSIQYANGVHGRKIRQLFDRSFNHEAVKDYYNPFIEMGKKMADEWDSLPANEHIPLMEQMINLAIESIGKAGMGKEFTDEKAKKFADSYHVCWNEMEIQLSGLALRENSERQKAFDEGRKLMRDTINSVMRKRSKDKEENPERLFIDAVVDCDFIDEEEMEDDLLSFFIGGFHTTGNMMGWCFYFLALHPEIQEKVYQELVEVLDEEDLDPMVADKLTYCRQVLDETLRCGVVAPWAARVENDHDMQIGEYVVAKGTPIITPLGVVLQDPELYPEPQRFDPERFSPEAMKELPTRAYEPFGFAGKRKCPGWRFSIAEGLVFLSIFVRRFKVKLVKGQKVEPVFGLVTSPKEEVWITVERR